jgi:hypothetical protein
MWGHAEKKTEPEGSTAGGAQAFQQTMGDKWTNPTGFTHSTTFAP